MTDPFEFSSRLLSWLQGTPDPEIARIVERNPALRELAGELRSSETVERELRAMAQFATPASQPHKRRRMWVAAAACVTLAMGTVICLLPRQAESAAVMLRTASGESVNVGAMSQSRKLANVELLMEDGTLKIEERRRPEVPVTNTITVAYAATQRVELPDGSHVHLNSGSELEFETPLGVGERRVSLRGEGFFEVEADEKRPFVVAARGMEVRAVGTKFNVKAYDDDGYAAATLTQGSVEVTAGGTRERLEPGAQAVWNDALSVRRVEPAVYTAWTEGMFYFHEQPLGEILRTVARWYDLEMVWQGTVDADSSYNGRIPMYSTANDVLRKIEMAGKVRLSLDGRTLIIN